MQIKVLVTKLETGLPTIVFHFKDFSSRSFGRHLTITSGEKTTDRSGRTEIMDRTDMNIVIDI